MAKPAKPAKPARVRLSAVKVDVENAFNQWCDSARLRGDGPDWGDCNAARDRVLAFFEQLEAKQAQLEAALIACVEVMDATDLRNGDACTQALMALGRYTN